jgi:hypothetical protein
MSWRVSDAQSAEYSHAAPREVQPINGPPKATTKGEHVFFEFQVIRAMARVLRDRLTAARAEPDAGYSTEAVVVTALLVALAIAAITIIAAKVLAKANSISTGS